MDPFDVSNHGELKGLLFGVLLVFTDDKVYGYDVGILLRSTDGKVLVIILVNLDGITPGLEYGIELVSLD